MVVASILGIVWGHSWNDLRRSIKMVSCTYMRLTHMKCPNGQPYKCRPQPLWLMCNYSYSYILLPTLSAHHCHRCGKCIGDYDICCYWNYNTNNVGLVWTLTGLRRRWKKESDRLQNCYICRPLRQLTMPCQWYKSINIVMGDLDE